MEVPFRSIDLGEAALRPYPTWLDTNAFPLENTHAAHHWARIQTDLERPQWPQWRALPLLLVRELVSLVARPDAVPYGHCTNLLLETRAKERSSAGGSNAKMRFKNFPTELKNTKIEDCSGSHFGVQLTCRTVHDANVLELDSAGRFRGFQQNNSKIIPESSESSSPPCE